ncbi:MAG: DUF429 domain-containing protein [Chloroflexota bacterium]|nr:DUF429 domain-containing protein [Chloroflexota bacterium]
MRTIAVDWSGALAGSARHIWLAEADQAGRLVRLSGGRAREQVAHDLLATMAEQSRVVIGLDFAFSFPSWYLRALGVDGGGPLWAQVAKHGERWLRECQPPFWGRPGKRRPLLEEHFRATERRLHQFGVKSAFQIGGAGAVGTGSIRGMPLLQRLRAGGASIWPFDPPGWPLVVEIYPRALTGAVIKSSATARRAYLAQRYPLLLESFAVLTEDAFDAAVSALVMAEHGDELSSLAAVDDAEARLEGRVWVPGSVS